MFLRSFLSLRAMQRIIGVGLLLGVSACGDNAPKWQPQDMFASNGQEKVNDTYKAMMDYKALARDAKGVEYAAGPTATVIQAVREAVALCEQKGGEECKAIRVGLTWVDGLDGEAIQSVITGYRDTLVAEATQSANQGNAEAANWLAFHYAEANEHLEEASDRIQQALKKDPENINFLDTYGRVLYRQGDYEKAEKVLIQVNKALPTAEHITHFADNALAMGKTKMARAAYQRALQAKPSALLAQEIQKRMLALDLGGKQVE